MKKHFLLISLFALMFLGLGNYTHAAVTCQDGSTKCDTLDLCDCSQPDLPDSDAWLCNTCKTLPTADATAKQNCLNDVVNGPGIRISAGGKMGCCNTACQTCKAKAGSVLTYDDFSKSISCADTDTQALQSNLCAGGLFGDGPKGGVINSIGVCVCPDGFKDIDHVCKPCSDPGVCCGVELNTSVPFIGKCIEDSSADKGVGETNVTGETAFPVLMGSLTQILVTVILILSFVLIVIGGIMMATGNPKGGMDLIKKVVIGIAILGASGVILRLINPNFFG